MEHPLQFYGAVCSGQCVIYIVVCSGQLTVCSVQLSVQCIVYTMKQCALLSVECRGVGGLLPSG